jgi:threonylcarbamoyladenosine tRNA methylthiotransferase MtaB
VDALTKKARSREMHELAAVLKRRELQAHLGQRVAVLWEQQPGGDGGYWSGYTPHYHKIISGDPEISAASISEVSIESISDDGSQLVNRERPAQVAVADIQLHDARN